VILQVRQKLGNVLVSLDDELMEEGRCLKRKAETGNFLNGVGGVVRVLIAEVRYLLEASFAQ